MEDNNGSSVNDVFSGVDFLITTLDEGNQKFFKYLDDPRMPQEIKDALLEVDTLSFPPMFDIRQLKLFARNYIFWSCDPASPYMQAGTLRWQTQDHKFRGDIQIKDGQYFLASLMRAAPTSFSYHSGEQVLHCMYKDVGNTVHVYINKPHHFGGVDPYCYEYNLDALTVGGFHGENARPLTDADYDQLLEFLKSFIRDVKLAFLPLGEIPKLDAAILTPRGKKDYTPFNTEFGESKQR